MAFIGRHGGENVALPALQSALHATTRRCFNGGGIYALFLAALLADRRDR